MRVNISLRCTIRMYSEGKIVIIYCTNRLHPQQLIQQNYYTVHLLSYYYTSFDSIHDVADVIVSHVGAGREAYSDFEEGFADTVDVGGSGAIDGLAVHRLPERTGFDVGLIEINAQSLYIVVGLAIGCGR